MNVYYYCAGDNRLYQMHLPDKDQLLYIFREACRMIIVYASHENRMERRQHDAPQPSQCTHVTIDEIRTLYVKACHHAQKTNNMRSRACADNLSAIIAFHQSKMHYIPPSLPVIIAEDVEMLPMNENDQQNHVTAMEMVD